MLLLEISPPSRQWMDENRLRFGDLSTAEQIAYLLGSETQLLEAYRAEGVKPYLLEMLVEFDSAIAELSRQLEIEWAVRECQKWHAFVSHVS